MVSVRVWSEFWLVETKREREKKERKKEGKGREEGRGGEGDGGGLGLLLLAGRHRIYGHFISHQTVKKKSHEERKEKRVEIRRGLSKLGQFSVDLGFVHASCLPIALTRNP